LKILKWIVQLFERLFKRRSKPATEVLDAKSVGEAAQQATKKVTKKFRLPRIRKDPHQRKYKKPKRGAKHPLHKDHFGNFRNVKPL